MDIDRELSKNTYFLAREDEFPRWRRMHEGRDQILVPPEFTVLWNGPRAVPLRIVEKAIEDKMRAVIGTTLEQADLIVEPQLLVSRRDTEVAREVVDAVCWSREADAHVVVGNLRAQRAFNTFSVTVVERDDWFWEPEGWEERSRRVRDEQAHSDHLARGLKRFSMSADL